MGKTAALLARSTLCGAAVLWCLWVTEAAGELVGRLTVSGHGTCGGRAMSRDPSQLNRQILQACPARCVCIYK